MYYRKCISTSSCSIAFWAKVRLSRQCVAILGFVSQWRIWLVTLRDDLARPDRTQAMGKLFGRLPISFESLCPK